MVVFFTKLWAYILVLCVTFLSLIGIDVGEKFRIAVPNLTNVKTMEETELIEADFYVSITGSDENDGSFAHPFASVDKARLAVRELNKTDLSSVTVAIMAGEYRIDCLNFTEEDSGTKDCPVVYCAYGDGEVIFNGGITLDGNKFTAVADNSVKSRFDDNVADKILCYDLTNDGITIDDLGKMYAIGQYNTADKYDGDNVGPIYCELFVNDTRMTLARFPDSGYLLTEKVISTGEGYESDGSLTKNQNWATTRNPKSDVYSINKDLADRINSWETLDDVWMFGFWKYDWADASTPIGSFDYENQTLSPAYVSKFGTKENAPYYFYNVLEEITQENEWYLDRNTGIIYIYPCENFSSAAIDLSLTIDNLLYGEDVQYLTFDGFTFKGTRGNAIDITGDNITIQNCLIKNISGDAIYLTGSNNLVTKCEITHTGKGGIYIDGGDRDTLTAGNSKADNNFIHDWAEIYQTYQPAVTLKGCGNICSHNEIYNSPHEAITYYGNNQLIEYNLIHDVCLLSSDAGAIYAGRRWDFYGTVIRYNCIYNAGSKEYPADGIYFDDALSGQTAYGNLIVNAGRNGIHVGGGRDMTIKNNIIVNAGLNSIYHDARALEGAKGGWFTHTASLEGDMWVNLFESNWQSEIWQEAYPQMKNFSSDYDNMDDPNFVPNPANNEITGNLIVCVNGKIGDIWNEAYEMGNISNNAIFRMTRLNEIFTDFSSGDYSLKKSSCLYDVLPEFTELPLNKIGRTGD